MKKKKVVRILPFEYDDPVLEIHVALRFLAPGVATLHIGKRIYYFNPKTGEFEDVSRNWIL